MYIAILLSSQILLAGLSLAELGLTASLLAHTHDFPSVRYQTLLIYVIVNTLWTTFFSISCILYGATKMAHHGDYTMGLSRCDFFVFAVVSCCSAITWVIAAALLRNGRIAGLCDGVPFALWCHQVVIVEVLGWTAFSLCAIPFLTIFGGYGWYFWAFWYYGC